MQRPKAAAIAVASLVSSMVFGLLGAAGACGGGPASPGARDGGDAALDHVNVDSEREIIVQIPSCANARTVCAGEIVLACVGGQPADELETCQDSCSLGRCTTPTCKAVESNEGARGCRFYGVQGDSIDSEDERPLMLILSNAGPTPAAARVEVPEPGGSWLLLATAVVPPGGGSRIQLHRPAREPGVAVAGAYRVETDAPVLAVQIVGDDSDQAARSSGGTVLLPVQGLGGKYLAVTVPAQTSAEVTRTLGSRGGAGAIAVVATAADTHVTVRLTAAATMLLGGAAMDSSLGSSEVTLSEGDVLQIFSEVPGADLTGTAIEADAPIAVFSGNVFTTYGLSVTAGNGGDLAQEQLPPTPSWGVEYLGARLSPQEGCEPFFGAGVGLWRVIAADGNTKVTVLPAPGTSIEATEAATLPSDLIFHLGRGEFVSFFARGSRNPPGSAAGDFLVQANEPILLVQWLDCEPGLALGVDTRMVPGDLAFTLPPAFDHEVLLVRKAATPLVTFDGVEVPDSLWKSRVGGYHVARLTAADLGRCVDAFDRCEHRVTGTAFAVSWRGMDIVCSYALTVPSRDVCALPTVTCIP